MRFLATGAKTFVDIERHLSDKGYNVKGNGAIVSPKDQRIFYWAYLNELLTKIINDSYTLGYIEFIPVKTKRYLEIEGFSKEDLPNNKVKLEDIKVIWVPVVIQIKQEWLEKWTSK